MKRNSELSENERRAIAETIARGAIRYFMIKFTKNKVIAFDFDEALAFDGDSGPYLQYAAVRAAKILEKVGATPNDVTTPDSLGDCFKKVGSEESEDVWALIFAATELATIVDTVVRTEEPAHIARFALVLAQRFNNFYHRYHIVKETDETKRALRLLAVQMFYREHTKALELMGIPVPERM